jgi:hypothetical protein
MSIKPVIANVFPAIVGGTKPAAGPANAPVSIPGTPPAGGWPGSVTGQARPRVSAVAVALNPAPASNQFQVLHPAGVIAAAGSPVEQAKQNALTLELTAWAGQSVGSGGKQPPNFALTSYLNALGSMPPLVG